MRPKIVISYEIEKYKAYLETDAMPGPTRSWVKECLSKEEVLEAVSQLLDCLPSLLRYPEEEEKKVKEEIEKLKIKKVQSAKCV